MKTKKKIKTKRLTKTEKMEAAALRNVPAPVVFTNNFNGEVLVQGWWSRILKKRVFDILTDRTDEGTAGHLVSFRDPNTMRKLAAALNAAADWMEETV